MRIASVRGHADRAVARMPVRFSGVRQLAGEKRSRHVQGLGVEATSRIMNQARGRRSSSGCMRPKGGHWFSESVHAWPVQRINRNGDEISELTTQDAFVSVGFVFQSVSPPPPIGAGISIGWDVAAVCKDPSGV